MGGKRAIMYMRVSTDRQGESGLGLESQETRAREYITAHSMELVGSYVEVASGRDARRRPQLQRALAELSAGKADALVVAKLDRLSRSLADFAGLMVTAKRENWSIVALDIGVDTASINGELVANIIAALAQWERQLIVERINSALTVARERGTQLGRPSNVDPSTLAAIVAMRHDDGLSWRAIAASLNDARIPTAQGGRQWHASTVRSLYQREMQAA